MTCTFQQMFTSCCLQSPIAQHANPERGDNHSSTVTPSSIRTSPPAALSSRIAAGTLVSRLPCSDTLHPTATPYIGTSFTSCYFVQSLIARYAFAG